MEEKLYFKPASYGKGTKKKREGGGGKNQQKPHRIRKLVIISLTIFIAILAILWLLRGQTIISGRYPDNIRNESVSCSSSDIIYPKLNMVESENHSLKINMIFNGVESLKTISLVYTLNYNNSDDAYRAEAISHAEFNQALNAKNYSVSKFSNKFSRYDNKLIVSLTASLSELDEYSAEYFMLDRNGDEKFNLRSLEDYENNFVSQGFTCESTYGK